MSEAKEKAVAVMQYRGGAIAALAERLGMEPSDLFMQSLKQVAFKTPNVTTEQLVALVLVANQYRLNPFTRELYAFPDRGGGIVPIVSVDGWLRIINEHPDFDGLSYEEMTDKSGALVAGQVTIHRKNRAHPLTIVEYLSEVKRNTDPWKLAEHRMLRHKTIIQGARVAFGFAGIYEADEGERILQAERVVRLATSLSGAERTAAALNVPALPEERGQAPQSGPAT